MNDCKNLDLSKKKINLIKIYDIDAIDIEFYEEGKINNPYFSVEDNFIINLDNNKSYSKNKNLIFIRVNPDVSFKKTKLFLPKGYKYEIFLGLLQEIKINNADIEELTCCGDQVDIINSNINKLYIDGGLVNINTSTIEDIKSRCYDKSAYIYRNRYNITNSCLYNIMLEKIELNMQQSSFLRFIFNSGIININTSTVGSVLGDEGKININNSIINGNIKCPKGEISLKLPDSKINKFTRKKVLVKNKEYKSFVQAKKLNY